MSKINADNIKEVVKAGLPAVDMNVMIRLGADCLQGKVGVDQILVRYGPVFYDAVKAYVDEFDVNDLENEAKKFAKIRKVAVDVKDFAEKEFSVEQVDLVPAVKSLAFQFVQKQIDAKMFMSALGKLGLENAIVQFKNEYKEELSEIKESYEVIAKAGGMELCYAASVEAYKILMETLAEAELQHEHRLMVEKECEESIRMIREYRETVQEMIEKYLTKYYDAFEKGLHEMDKAILDNDSDGYIRGSVEIQKVLGYESRFHDQKEFDDLMMSDMDFKL